MYTITIEKLLLKYNMFGFPTFRFEINTYTCLYVLFPKWFIVKGAINVYKIVHQK